jgi:Ca2+-binding EF-hand superfamily protein
MKISLGTVLVLAGLVTVPATVAAMEPFLPNSPKVFKRVDTNKDGKVSPSEMQPLVQKRFLNFDADKSGDVTASEIDVALQKAMERRRDRMLKNLDKDMNGSISKAELDQAVEALLLSADTDSDGSVTLVEVRQLRLAKARKPAEAEKAKTPAAGETPN